MASLSASLTENRLDKANQWFIVVFAVAVVTTGAELGATEIAKGDQAALSAALHSRPSKARTCRLSPTAPVTKMVWGSVLPRGQLHRWPRTVTRRRTSSIVSEVAGQPTPLLASCLCTVRVGVAPSEHLGSELLIRRKLADECPNRF